MTTLDELTAGARTFLRDFPQYFEVDEGPLNVLTVRLPHPLVSGNTLQVYLTPTPTEAVPNPATTMTNAWQLDERNGLLKLTDVTALNQSVLVSGYHFIWFTDSDLAFHVNKIVNEMTFGGDDLSGFYGSQLDVIQLGGVVSALWSLAMELSLDIDVSTPEGMFIPARQRFTQVMQLVQFYEAEYQSKAAMLNMGLNALEVFRLRRIALMTGRYVPVYKEREFDDPRPPERLYPEIPSTVPQGPDSEFSVEVVSWDGM